MTSTETLETTSDALVAALDGFMLRVMSADASKVMAEFVALDLSMAHVRILLSLSTDGAEVTITEIAQRVGLSLITAGRSVDRLVGVGFVCRREDAQDRRMKRVSLTPEGRQHMARQITMRRENLRSIAEQLTPTQRRSLTQALGPVLAGSPERARHQPG